MIKNIKECQLEIALLVEVAHNNIDFDTLMKYGLSKEKYEQYLVLEEQIDRLKGGLDDQQTSHHHTANR